MSIAIDFITTYNSDNTGTFYTATHACSGSERGLLVFASNTSQAVPHNITYNGVTMSKEVDAQEGGTGKRVSIWSLIGPATGTNSVAISYSAAVAAAFTIISLTGVNQTDMVSNFTSSTGSSTTPTLQISSTATDVVFDAICFDTTTASAGGNQTQRGNHGNPSIHGATSQESGSSTVTMAWTLAASEEWVTGAVSVVPASASSQPATQSSISIDAITTAQTDNTGTAYTVSHACSGANRGLLVLCSFTSQSYPHFVTYAGVNMTHEGSNREVPTGKQEQIWSLIAPTSGTANVILSLSAAVAMAVTIISLNNVDQVDMVGGYVGASASNNTPSTNLPATTGDLVFDSLAFDTVAASPVAADQTSRAHHGNAYVLNAVSSKPGTGVVNMQWSLTGIEDWVLGAVNVRPFVGLAGKAPHSTIMLNLARRRNAADYDYYTICQNPLPADTSTSAAPAPSATGSLGPRISLVPGFLSDDAQWKRQTAAWMLEANQGRLNNTGIVTLAANASSTTVQDERVGVDSFIGLMPRTANAATEKASGVLYVLTDKQTFTIAHSNNAQTDRTFVYSILG